MVLLDALEIACSLGPSDAIVDHIQSTDLNAKKIKTKNENWAGACPWKVEYISDTFLTYASIDRGN